MITIKIRTEQSGVKKICNNILSNEIKRRQYNYNNNLYNNSRTSKTQHGEHDRAATRELNSLTTNTGLTSGAFGYDGDGIPACRDSRDWPGDRPGRGLAEFFLNSGGAALKHILIIVINAVG